MKKKILFVILVVIFVIPLSACGKNKISLNGLPSVILPVFISAFLTKIIFVFRYFFA